MTTRRQFFKTGFENNKLAKRLYRQVGKAIGDFYLIEDGDKVMVCLSGGKDSFAMLDILLGLQARAPVHFDIIAVNLDQNLPGFPKDILPVYLKEKNIPFHIETQDTYSIIRRLIPETKIALGHHRDDILETFFLNLFFGAKIKSMPPKLKTNDGKHIVIRPLAYVKETDIEHFAEIRQYPVFPKNLCGAKENQQRRQIKTLIREWEKRYPGRIENIFSSLSTVVPSHLMDNRLYDFGSLTSDENDTDRFLPETTDFIE